MRNNITFKKLILLFITVAIPLFLFSFFLLYYHNSVTQKRTLTSIQEKIQLTIQTFDSSIRQLYSTESAVASQSNITKITSKNYPMDDYDQTQEILQLQEQQNSILQSNSYIDNFIIYYKNQGKAYNTTTASRPNPSFFKFTAEEYTQMIDLYGLPGYIALYNNQLTEIFLPSTDPDFILRIDLSSEAITSLLENMFHDYTFYYLLDAFDSTYQLTNLSPEQLAEIPKEFKADKISLDGGKYYYFSSDLPGEAFTIYYFINDNQLFANTQAYQYMYLFLGILTLLSCSFFLWGSYTNIQKPIHMLVDAFHEINQQDYSIRISTVGNSDFTYLYTEFNRMAQKLEKLIEKDYQQQLLLNKAELKQLQAQINPHFLYNAFFLLRRMLYEGLYEEATEMSDTLGQYFQYITRNTQDYVPLYQEYNHAMLYCEIQQLRFEGRICIEKDTLPKQYYNILVPKLIIQPILENAFNHGLKDKVLDGLLRITFSVASDTLIFSIEDNGEDLPDSQLTQIQQNLQLSLQENSTLEKTGILNIHRRLHIYSNGTGYLTASRSTMGGLCIRLCLPIQQPFIKEEDHDKNTAGR